MKYFSVFKYIYILLTLFAFSSSSSGVEVRFNGIYGYDLNANSLVAEKTDVLYEKYTYDEGCNFIHCGVEQSLKTQSEKTLGGSFFAFEVSLVATKELPRSGPIAKSLSAASRSERLERKFNLNLNSPVARQVLNSLDDTVGDFISKFRKPTIRAKIPGEFLDQTVDEALRSGNTTVRKLLIDNRFVK